LLYRQKAGKTDTSHELTMCVAVLGTSKKKGNKINEARFKPFERVSAVALTAGNRCAGAAL